MAGGALRALRLIALGGGFLACGGRVELEHGAPAPNGIAGGSGAPVSGGQPGIGSGGVQAGTGGMSAAATSGDASGGLPPTLPVRCSSPVHPSCSPTELPLELRGVTVDPASGVSAEPLQVPNYGVRPGDYTPSFELPDPSVWDRSARPAGACVFRLRGVQADCLLHGLLFVGVCPEPGFPGVAPDGFYESHVDSCSQSPTPGCPTADPWSLVGAWWYLQHEGAELELVVCAPECVLLGSSGTACLRAL